MLYTLVCFDDKTLFWNLNHFFTFTFVEKKNNELVQEFAYLRMHFEVWT